MTNDELLHKWINHTLTPEELQEFQQRPEYESLVLLYKNTASYRAPRFEGDTMLTEILAQPKQQPQTRTAKRVVFKWQRYAAVAAVFFVIGLLVWYQTGNPTLVTHQTARADTFEGQLPDGSSFTLYSESKLNYNTDNWTQNRTLNLDGEALFRVAKGAAFRVKTQNGQVQVLGTTFHVQSRKRILNVTCQEGKVAILNTQ
ncbi:MAG: FecR family protein, partial [Bacteroidota bacterium]